MTRTVSPAVSVVVPTYNRAEMLPRAVDSVLTQTYRDFELVIVDDGSNDDTTAVIAGFGDRRVRSIRHRRNLGQSKTLNTGIENARGRYVAFLDDDDEWLPHKLADQVEVFRAAGPEVGLVTGWMDVLDGNGRCVRQGRWQHRGNLYERMLALHVPTPPSLWMLRTEAVRAIGGFDEDASVGNDVEFCTRLCNDGWHVEVVPNVVAVKHAHLGEQMTDRTETNLAAGAAMVRRHLTRFAAELRERPSALAAVYLHLARYLRPYRREFFRALVVSSRLDFLRVLETYLPKWLVVRFSFRVLRALRRRLRELRARTSEGSHNL